MIEDLGRHKSKQFTHDKRVVEKALRSLFFLRFGRHWWGLRDQRVYTNCYDQETFSVLYCCVSTGKVVKVRALL